MTNVLLRDNREEIIQRKSRLEIYSQKVRTPGAARIWKRQGRILPWSFPKLLSPTDTDTFDFKCLALRTVEEKNSIVVSHLVYGSFLAPVAGRQMQTSYMDFYGRN